MANQEHREVLTQGVSSGMSGEDSILTSARI